VKRVVNGFGDGEEGFAAFENFPLDVQAKFLEQRDEAIENFRHAAADGRGIDHFDALAQDKLGDGANFIDFGLAHDGGMIFEADVADGVFGGGGAH
jgi:hypothetical protein